MKDFFPLAIAIISQNYLAYLSLCVCSLLLTKLQQTCIFFLYKSCRRNKNVYKDSQVAAGLLQQHKTVTNIKDTARKEGMTKALKMSIIHMLAFVLSWTPYTFMGTWSVTLFTCFFIQILYYCFPTKTLYLWIELELINNLFVAAGKPSTLSQQPRYQRSGSLTNPPPSLTELLCAGAEPRAG